VTRHKIFGRARFYVGNAIRLVTKPWKQYQVSFDEASNVFACSYGDHGWHHLRKTLAEYDANPDIDVRETTLFAYLSRFCPTSICDLVDWPEDEPRLPLFVYPWGTFKKGETESRKSAQISRFCGPSSPEFIAGEYAATIRLYEAMKAVGYRPWHFDNTFIAGTLLVRANGERRFVVLQGNHRAAVLAHLGLSEIAVRPLIGHVAVIRETDAPRWPLVAMGRCRVESALRIFNLYFESNGHHIGERLKQAGSSPNYR
jgi:hypothetical protein